MNENDYGKVKYYNLTDEKNLSYLPNRSKKISVYTPPDYDENKKFSVVYAFDGQNLYKKAEGREPNKDSHGSWAVDEACANTVKKGLRGAIIVGIDDSDGYRDKELTMSSDFGEFGNLDLSESFLDGKLNELGKFLIETVFPFVKERYSVADCERQTAIVGSSSGGLAAYYLGLKYNDLFGYIGAFSPANAIFSTSAWNNFYSKKDFSKNRPTVYVYSGYNDGFIEDDLINGAKTVRELTRYGYDDAEIIERFIEYGLHNESYWRAVFPQFLELFLKRTV